MIHKLKTIQPYFNEVKEGKKTFELRKNDRGFKQGDLLILEEFDPELGYDAGYTGKAFVVRVEYLLEGFDGIEEGYCILGVKKSKL